MPAEPRRRRTLLWQVLTGGLVLGTLLLLSGRVDHRPPVLSVAPLDARSGGNVVVTGTVGDARPGLDGVWARVDGGELVPVPVDDGALTWDITALADGAHRLELVASDRSWLANRAVWTGALTVDATPPTAAVSWSVPPRPGSAGALYVRTAVDCARGDLLLLGRTHPLVLVEDGLWRAIVALPLDLQEPTVSMRIELADDLGNAALYEAVLDVVPVEWTRGGGIVLTAAQRRDRDDHEALEKMEAERAVATGQVVDAPLVGSVQQPVTGWVSSPFGRVRTYSDGKRQHHLGMDIANVVGTPVLAMAGGQVSLAGEQPIHGRTVIVDHGLGITSSYSHLSAIDVAVGATLGPGQQLGRVGSTGQSTGPHLHWEILVGGTPVDPKPWVDAVPLALGPDAAFVSLDPLPGSAGAE